MEYKDYLIRDGRLIKRGNDEKETEGIEVDEIESIDKIHVSKRKILAIGILSVIFIGSLVVGGSLITSLVMFGSFILMAATGVSVFVTDRYAIKTQDNEMRLSVRGSDGHQFMGEVQERAGHYVDPEFSYGGLGDSFVDSAREKQLNLGMALLIVVGAVLGAGVVAPMYSDNITWEGVTDVVEAVGGSDDTGDSTGDVQAVYEEDEDENVFSSEYATVEFSQGSEDLDRSDSTPETYVNIDFTPQVAALISVYVEVPRSQNMGTEENIDNLEDGETYEIGYTVTEDDDEWVRTIPEGELEFNNVIGRVSEDESYLDETQTLRPGPGAPGSVTMGGELTNMEADTDKFIKGMTMTKTEGLNAEDIDPNNPEESIEYPDVVGFEQGDRIRVVGTLSTEEGPLDVVLGEYVVE